MPILGKIKDKETVLVGGHMPPEVHSYLTLYALAKGTTKAGILEDLIRRWMAEREEENDEVLLEQIVQRAQMQWDNEKQSQSGMTFQKFKKELDRELDYKSLPRKYIDMILFEIKE